MRCKFCGGPVIIHPEICQKCFPALHVVEDTAPSVMEHIIRFVSVRKFLEERRKQKP